MFDSWRALEEDSSVAGTGPNLTGRYSWPRSRAVWVRACNGGRPLVPPCCRGGALWPSWTEREQLAILNAGGMGQSGPG